MYSSNFCKVYNEFGWNYFPEAFGEQLLIWMERNGFEPESMLDIGCGTGILCDILQQKGIAATGIDLSEGMIGIAREEHAGCRFEVANMITYQPRCDMTFDLVTCTGDALNHILNLEDIMRVFQNVYGYLNQGGYFIFDILNEKETGDGEPIDLDYDEHVKAQFQIRKNPDRTVTLSIHVYEDGVLQVTEEINEIVYDPEVICRMLIEAGFSKVTRSNQLLEGEKTHSTTWYIIAEK